ncbi:hypothetical protein JTE90_000926 [Oedothorax gibbosus]|uniref:Uncharacterized protein n=1 Tax=Oedothorax gibbosus TaxID=931172 RepID=A0AAV6U3V8_9ARAC|nr:hypothetical protein JTE90_000926 [Oedothorax gibbosus]
MDRLVPQAGFEPTGFETGIHQLCLMYFWVWYHNTMERGRLGGGVFICLFAVFVGGVALLTNTKSRPLLKFCFNSRDQFVATSALMNNITSTEAVCIISNCLQQVRQSQPQFTGRRRRSSEEAPLFKIEEEEPEVLEAKEVLREAQPSLPEFLAKVKFLEGVTELEAAVVDTIEVNVAEEEPDYE